ncbi:hypothetical protein BJF80_13205 [Serinicoccus sp. CUA-874]|uniref:hypothetical protein n=1 Tax=Serinicoccus sp. CUA-874 TaxID=1517939 RepID=UPI0009672819|nr:hypothetical protein [Serinicoccus sp. CUA-874]OLT19010.1 hypothetical protein BJF80_13205 [Serinicoccus sp. CUA-874]
MKQHDPVTKYVFRRAVAAVRGGDLASVVQQDMTSTVGRTRSQRWDAMFVLFMVAAIEGCGDLHLTSVHEVSDRLSRKQVEQIGLRLPVTYSQVESAVSDLADAMTEQVHPETGEVQETRLSLSLTDFMTSLVSQVIPRSLRGRATLALDSTDYEAWSRRRSWASHMRADDAPGSLPEPDFEPPKKRAVNEPGWPKPGHDGRLQHTVDPDARDGYRSGKNLARKGIFSGWDVHLATHIPEHGGQAEAALTQAVCLAPAGSYKAAAGVEVVDSLVRAGMAPETLLVDRGYSYAKQDAWALPLVERDVEQVFDLHPSQRGTRPGPINGTIWVDGGLFLDHLPKDLRDLPGYSLGMTATAKAQLAQTYDRRQPWAFTPMGGPHPERGTQRFRGPALAGRVRCVNISRSMRLNPASKPTTSCRKGETCACGRTLTLAREEMAQLRQRDLFGTTAWRASYGRRGGVESLNASLSEHHGHLRRGSTRVLGTHRTGILLGFILAATNVRILMACYGYDIGNPPPEGTEIKSQPSTSQALHRRLPFKRRQRRAKSRPPGSGPPRSGPRLGSTTAWEPLKDNTKTD